MVGALPRAPPPLRAPLLRRFARGASDPRPPRSLRALPRPLVVVGVGYGAAVRSRARRCFALGAAASRSAVCRAYTLQRSHMPFLKSAQYHHDSNTKKLPLRKPEPRALAPLARSASPRPALRAGRPSLPAASCAGVRPAPRCAPRAARLSAVGRPAFGRGVPRFALRARGVQVSESVFIVLNLNSLSWIRICGFGNVNSEM